MALVHLIYQNYFFKLLQTLRPSGNSLLIIPSMRTKTHGEAFQFYSPRLWNSLPEDLRVAESADVFKRRSKTYLFCLGFKLVHFYTNLWVLISHLHPL